MQVDLVLAAAINEAVKAGVFRRAARLNPKTAKTWQSFAELHSERVEALLGEFLDRSGAGGAGPCSRCG